MLALDVSEYIAPPAWGKTDEVAEKLLFESGNTEDVTDAEFKLLLVKATEDVAEYLLLILGTTEDVTELSPPDCLIDDEGLKSTIFKLILEIDALSTDFISIKLICDGKLIDCSVLVISLNFKLFFRKILDIIYNNLEIK
jgi:hypothetical protein